MDGQETVIGEVIGQFYSFFGSLMQLRENITTSPGLSQTFRDGVLEQLANLESEWAGHYYLAAVFVWQEQLIPDSLGQRKCPN